LSVHVLANKMCVQYARYVVFSSNFYGLTFNMTTCIVSKDQKNFDKYPYG